MSDCLDTIISLYHKNPASASCVVPGILDFIYRSLHGLRLKWRLHRFYWNNLVGYCRAGSLCGDVTVYAFCIMRLEINWDSTQNPYNFGKSNFTSILFELFNIRIYYNRNYNFRSQRIKFCISTAPFTDALASLPLCCSSECIWW